MKHLNKNIKLYYDKIFNFFLKLNKKIMVTHQNSQYIEKNQITGIISLKSEYFTNTNGNNPTIKSEYIHILHTDDVDPVEHTISGDSTNTKYRIISSQSHISNDFKDGTDNTITYNYVTTLITDMNLLFLNKTSFNRNISNWDVSNVTSMTEMFRNTPFNQPLNNWDVSKVTNTKDMFFVYGI